MEKIKYKPEEKWNSVASQMVQRFKETSHPVFISASALSGGTLRTLKGKETIHFKGGCLKQNSCSESFILKISSVFKEQFRTGEQFGLTEDEKGQEKISTKENP